MRESKHPVKDYMRLKADGHSHAWIARRYGITQGALKGALERHRNREGIKKYKGKYKTAQNTRSESVSVYFTKAEKAKLDVYMGNRERRLGTAIRNLVLRAWEKEFGERL